MPNVGTSLVLCSHSVLRLSRLTQLTEVSGLVSHVPCFCPASANSGGSVCELLQNYSLEPFLLTQDSNIFSLAPKIIRNKCLISYNVGCRALIERGLLGQ